MSCTISLPEHPIVNAIKSVSKNDVESLEILLNACDENFNFTKEFKEWYKNKYPNSKKTLTSINDIAKNSIKKYTNDLIEYYNNRNNNAILNKKTIAYTDKVNLFGYNNAIDRAIGVTNCSTLLLKLYKGNLERDNLNYSLDDYKKDLQQQITQQILFRLIDVKIIKSMKEATPYLKELLNMDDVSKKVKYFEKLIGKKNLNTVLFQNWMALYKEIHSDKYATELMNEAFSNKKCFPIYQSLVESKDETKLNNEKDNEELEENGNIEEGSESSDADSYDFIKAYDHSGIKRSSAEHLSDALRLYFDTLIRQDTPAIDISTVNPVDCVRNSYGMFEYMSAEECSNILQNLRFTDVGDMINQIEQFGYRHRGYGAFVKMAEDLKKDPMLAIECATVFLKPKVVKSQMTIKDGKAVVEQANKSSDKEIVLKKMLYDDLRKHVGTLNVEAFKKEVADLKQEYKSIYEEEQLNALIKKVISLYKKVLPSFQEGAFYSYLEKDDKRNRTKSEKVFNLLYALDNNDIRRPQQCFIGVVELGNEAKAKQDKKNDKIIGENKALIKEYGSAWAVPADKLKSTSYDLQFNGDSFYYQTFKDIIFDNSVILTDLSSPNIEKQNSSDIINSSWITQLNDILTKGTDEELLAWGREKLTNVTSSGKRIIKSQYKYVPYLFAVTNKTDDNMNRFAYVQGIFDINEKGELILFKEYGQERNRRLFSVQLLNGITNPITGTSVTYSKMTEMDSRAFKFNAYFNGLEDFNLTANDGLRNYFLRTPSDATNIFTVIAPQLQSNPFYLNEKQINKNIENAVNYKIPIIDTRSEDSKIKEFVKQFKQDFIPIQREGLFGSFDLLDDIKFINKDYLKEHGKISFKNNENDKYLQAHVLFLTQEGYVAFVKLKLRNSGTHSDAYAITDKQVLAIKNKQFNIESSDNGIIFGENTNDVNQLPSGLIKSESDKLKYRFESLSPFKKLSVTNPITEEHMEFDKVPLTFDITNNLNAQTIFNIFKQEMLDGMTALSHYVKLVPDYTYDDNGNPIKDNQGNFILSKNRYIIQHNNDGSIALKEGVDLTKGYANYHLQKGKKVIEGDPKKGYQLLGNVFNSNKFTVNTVDENGNVVTRNPLQELIKHGHGTESNDLDFLSYGGGISVSLNEDGSVNDIYFTPQQEQAIVEKLQEWGNLYISKKFKEISTLNKDFLPGINKNFNTKDGAIFVQNIRSYAINTFVIHNTYDALLGGNTKFYKGAQDLFKREKEIEASGNPYGIANKGTNDFLSLNGQTIFSLNNCLQQNGITGIFTGLELTSTFNGITIKNTTQTNNSALMEIYNVLLKQNVSPIQAAQLLWGRVKFDENGNLIPIKNKQGETIAFETEGGAFTDSKVNDAQSYITIQEFVRRIAGRGQLKKYLPLLKKLQDPNTVIEKEDLTAFVQVQKNFYYDLWTDPRYGIEVPRQIKNAEFVLIPQLIKGTQLEEVYNLMRRNNIDQLNTVETSKAANEELLTLWDNDGNLTLDAINQFEQSIQSDPYLVQPYNYRYLYTQQDNPQHMNAKNKLSVQIVKKMYDNISKSTNPALNNIKEQWFRLLNINVKESAAMLLNELGIPHDINGNIIAEDGSHIEFNRQYIAEMMKQELLRTGCNSNMISCVTIDENGEYQMMPYITSVIDKFESVIQSMYTGRITKQEMPGFHVAQVTNVGWESINYNILDYTKEQLKTNRLVRQYLNEGNTLKTNKKTGLLTEESRKALGDWLELNNPIPDYAKQLRYHPNGEGYIEVMIPYSYLGIDRHSEHYKDMTDEEILKELDEEGLLDFLGYRIPTEGKQSVAHMKVVAFLDSTFGSTMIVPNEWVAQTGSDFDYDSIYGIQYESRFDNNGRCRKVTYKETGFNEFDYFNYINKHFPKNPAKNAQLKLTDAQRDEVYTQDKLNLSLIQEKENKAFGNLSKWARRLIIDANKKIKALQKEDNVKGYDAYIEATEQIIAYIEEGYFENNYQKIYKKEAFKKKEIKQDIDNGKLEAFVNAQKEILNFLQENNSAEKIKAINENLFKEKLKQYEEFAEANGLLTYEQYLALPTEQKNSRRQRNSKILEGMIEIADDPKMLEEIVMRSNSDDIEAELEQLSNPNILAERLGRSMYDTEDQGKFQEDANAGKQLKGMSVDADGLCSICNTVKPILSRPIKVVYNPSETRQYDAVEAVSRFGSESNNNINILNNGNKTVLLVDHVTYGWSGDNRAMSGKLLTSYSSETTAYILDAVKKGSLPNVNVNTFMVLKTLANLGVDYHSSLAFMMQPAMTRLCENINKTNSVFATFKPDAVNQTIKEICAELLGEDIKSGHSVSEWLSLVNEKYKEKFNALYDIEGINLSLSANPNATDKYAIRVDLLEDRIFETGIFDKTSPVEERMTNELLFDLANILLYQNINAKAQQISSIGRCLKTDKFNQKPTPFMVRKLFQDIRDNIVKTDSMSSENNVDLIGVAEDTSEQETITNSETTENSETDTNSEITETAPYEETTEEGDNFTIEDIKERKPILTVNDKHILAAVYPGMDNIHMSNEELLQYIIEHDDSKISAYPSLYAFFKNSSCLSMLINKSIFDVQSDEFVDKVNGITDVFSDNRNRLDEQTYKDVAKYIISNIFTEVPYIKYPILSVYRNEGRLMVVPDTNANPYDEMSRVYGYSTTELSNLTNLIKDVNSPTGEELSKWYKLTPAEKVVFIKTNPKFENKGIFDFIEPALYLNPKFRNKTNQGIQSLNYKLFEGIQENTLFYEFQKSLNSENPLFASAVLDVIKYGMLVEGMRSSRRGMTQLISFEALYDSIIDNTGKTFKNSVEDLMDIRTGNSSKTNRLLNMPQIYENYLRSHSNCKQVNSINIRNRNYSDLAKYYVPTIGSMYFIKNENIMTDDFAKELNKYKIAYKSEVFKTFKLNNYIRIGDGKKSTLFRIKKLKNGVLLYPLSNLDMNEQGMFSVTPENNMTYDKKNIFTKVAYELMIGAYEESAKQDAIEKTMRDTINGMDESLLKPQEQQQLSLKTYIETGNQQAIALRNKIQEFGKNTDGKRLFMLSNLLENHILHEGIKNGITIQTDGQLYRIYKLGVPEQMYLRNIAKEKLAVKDTSRDFNLRNALLEKTTNESLINLVERAVDRNSSYFGNVFVTEKITNNENLQEYENSEDFESFDAGYLEDVENDAKQLANENNVSTSTLANMISNTFGFIHVQQNEGFEKAITFLNDLRYLGINSKVTSIQGNEEVVMQKLSKFAQNFEESVIKELNNFVADPSDDTGMTKLTAFDKKVLEQLKTNKLLLEKYMNLINKVKGFIKTFDDFKQLIDDTEDVEIKTRLKRIAETVDSLKKVNIDALASIANSAIVSKSHNTLLRQQVIDVLDGFWKTYGMMWQFNDIMENGNPIVQLVLKDVMSDIDAKDKMSAIKKREFKEAIQKLKDEAKQRGVTIDFDKFIDKDGRFIQDYKPKFVEDYLSFKKATTEAMNKYGKGSIEHLKAKLEFDKFKAKYINQEVDPAYYNARNNLMEDMVTKYPDIISKYYTALYKYIDYASTLDFDNLTPEEESKINNLFSELMPIQMFGDDERAIDILTGFKDQLGRISEEYFEDQTDEDFETILKKQMEIIAKAEKRDAFGIPQALQEDLNNNKEYVAARKWLSKNAKFVLEDARYAVLVNPENPNSIKNISLDELVKEYFALFSGYNSSAVSNYLTELKRIHPDCVDEHNKFNAVKLTNEEREKLHNKQIQDFYKAGKQAIDNLENQDIFLLSCCPKNDQYFSKWFYKQITNRESHKNPKRFKYISEANAILSKYFNNGDGIVHLEKIPDTKEGREELKQLALIFHNIRVLDVQAKQDSYLESFDPDLFDAKENSKSYFLNEFVKFKRNESAWRTCAESLEGKSDEYTDLFLMVAGETEKQGNDLVVKLDKQGKVIPNRFLFTTMELKDASEIKEKAVQTILYDEHATVQDFIDKVYDKQEERLIKIYNDIFRVVPTAYYEQEAARARHLTDEEYKKWYDLNHVWNPYTKKMQPIACWTTTEVRPQETLVEGDARYKWQAKGRMRHSRVRNGEVKSGNNIDGTFTTIYDANFDRRNLKYDKNKSLIDNYNGHEDYASNANLNEQEQKMRDLMFNTIMNEANTQRAKDYFSKGYLPKAMKPKPFGKREFLKETQKFFGISTHSIVNTDDDFKQELSYESDYLPPTPMMANLNNKETIALDKEIAELKKKASLLTDNNEITEINNTIEEKEKQLREMRSGLLNRDWESVIEGFIGLSSRYNAIQENKQKLYYLLNMLRDFKMYRKSKGMIGKLSINRQKSDTANDVIVPNADIDTALITQYETQLRRLLFDQWKESDGWLRTLMDNLQGFTSANYMMMNIKGGIANVTVGLTGMFAEMMAKEYVSTSDWSSAVKEYVKGSLGYIHSFIKSDEPSFNKQDAIIRFFNVVDYDEIEGVVTRGADMNTISKKVRDAMFSPQTMGEHFMQNSMLFAMLKSHKLITKADGTTEAMSFEDFVNYKQEEFAYTEILTDEQRKKYREFVKEIKTDKDKLEKYATYKRDLMTDFVYLNCDAKTYTFFINKRSENRKELKEEFDKETDLYNQLSFENGKLTFVANSKLADINAHKNEHGTTEAIDLLADFSEKVRKVNNKIHGVYNRMGAAQIESKWWGSLVMQYHKHLPMGLLKRYRIRGYFNETRKTVEKGALATMKAMLNLNFEKIATDHGLKPQEMNALRSFTYSLAHIGQFLHQMKTTYNVVPEYERANLRRQLGDALGVLAGLIATFALLYFGDDDDDSLAYNLMLYEADRLVSETALYSPIGMMSETKKLMSTPIAAQTIVSDGLKIVQEAAGMMFDPDFLDTYQAGMYAGQSKLGVYIQRRIPVYSTLHSLYNIDKNNKYYKLSENISGLLNIKAFAENMK